MGLNVVGMAVSAVEISGEAPVTASLAVTVVVAAVGENVEMRVKMAAPEKDNDVVVVAVVDVESHAVIVVTVIHLVADADRYVESTTPSIGGSDRTSSCYDSIRASVHKKRS